MINNDFDENYDEMLKTPSGMEFKKILVVDDIMYVVKSISRILRSQGYFVITAMTGKDALEKFDKYKPDLITVDQKLPDMSGLQLVGKIKEHIGGDKVKVIAERDPAQLPWSDLGVDIVVESTGVFRQRAQLENHLNHFIMHK